MERWDEANESFEASYDMAKAQSSPFVVRTCMVWAKSNAVRGDVERAVAGVDKCLADHRDDPASTLELSNRFYLVSWQELGPNIVNTNLVCDVGGGS